MSQEEREALSTQLTQVGKDARHGIWKVSITTSLGTASAVLGFLYLLGEIFGWSYGVKKDWEDVKAVVPIVKTHTAMLQKQSNDMASMHQDIWRLGDRTKETQADVKTLADKLGAQRRNDQARTLRR